MYMMPLEKEKYDYFELCYKYKTTEHYKVKVQSGKEKMSLEYVREKLPAEKEVENTDTLFQDYWENPEAYAVCKDETGEILGYLEIATNEWNGRLVMTQLLVKENARGMGAGKFMVDFVKSVAKERDYRIIVLETQNYNTPAIDFYLSQGFVFCGGNVYFYSNEDIEDEEVMLEMAYLL